MRTLSDYQQMFMDQIDESHIKYDRDAGHSYSYIDHPMMSEIYDLDGPDCDDWVVELIQFCDEWLSEHEECPPCDIYIDHKNQEILSSCGCHDHLDYHEDREEWEDIVTELTNE